MLYTVWQEGEPPSTAAIQASTPQEAVERWAGARAEPWLGSTVLLVRGAGITSRWRVCGDLTPRYTIDPLPAPSEQQSRVNQLVDALRGVDLDTIGVALSQLHGYTITLARAEW